MVHLSGSLTMLDNAAQVDLTYMYMYQPKYSRYICMDMGTCVAVGASLVRVGRK